MLKKKLFLLMALMLLVSLFLSCESDDEDGGCYLRFKNKTATPYAGIRFGNLYASPFYANTTTEYGSLTPGSYYVEVITNDGTWKNDTETKAIASDGFYYTLSFDGSQYSLSRDSYARSSGETEAVSGSDSQNVQSVGIISGLDVEITR